jgi:hypothetical protein
MHMTGGAIALRVAPIAAAVAASIGDLLLLHVAAASRADGDVHLAWMLLAGHYLGVLGIPLYALGYWQVSAAIARPGLARSTFTLGAASAALGAAIHGTTAVAIAAARASTATAEPAAPVTTFAGADLLAPFAEFLVPLWVLAGLGIVAASIVFAVATATGGSRYPRWMAALNPLALVLCIAAIGAVSPAAHLIVPAAPNLAHVVLFAIAAWLDAGTPR